MTTVVTDEATQDAAVSPGGSLTVTTNPPRTRVSCLVT